MNDDSDILSPYWQDDDEEEGYDEESFDGVEDILNKYYIPDNFLPTINW